MTDSFEQLAYAASRWRAGTTEQRLRGDETSHFALDVSDYQGIARRKHDGFGFAERAANWRGQSTTSLSVTGVLIGMTVGAIADCPR
jgi:hypothetical protein